MPDIRRTVDAVWRIEGEHITATLSRMTGDVGLAEDLAQEAVVDSLKQWPEAGVPQNAGAWLTTVAKRKAIDGWRRRERLDERYRAIAHESLRLSRVLAGLFPREPEVHGLVAQMEFQTQRFASCCSMTRSPPRTEPRGGTALAS